MATSLAFDLIARDRASDKFDKVGNSAEKSGGKLKAFAKVGVLAVAAGAAVAGKALFDMTKAAMEDEAAQAKLAKALQNSAGATNSQVKATESWISKQGLALGVTDDELRPALTRLVASTGDVSKAQKLASLGMDISAGSGKSLKSVTDLLAKAQDGNVAGLSKLGVKTKDAEGKTRSLRDITADLAKTYDSQASTAANTTAGKFDRLKLMFDETKETIGAKLIPVAAKLATFLVEKVIPAVGKTASWISENLGPTFSKIAGFVTERLIPALTDLYGKALEGVRGMFKNVGKSMEENKPFIDQLVVGFKKLAGFVVDKVMPAVGDFYKVALPALGTAIGKGIGFLRKYASGWLGMAAFGVKALRLLLGGAMATFSGILKAADVGMSWIPGIGDKIKNARKAFDNFRDKTVANLKRTEDALLRVKGKIDGVKSPKPLNIRHNVPQVTNVLSGLLTKIKDINGSTMTIYVNQITSTKGPNVSTDLYGGNLPRKAGENARGTGFWRGGITKVGEEGPELVELPAGSRIHDAGRSARMAMDGGGGLTFDYEALANAIIRALERGTQLVRLPDAGRGAYAQGAGI